MKKLLVILLLAVVAFSACKKDKNDPLNSTEAQAAKHNFSRALNISFNVLIMIREAYIENNCQLFPNASPITITPYGNGKIIRFDFGGGLACTDGVVRKGSIIDTLTETGPSGQMHNIYFENYYEDDVRVRAGIMTNPGGELNNIFATGKYYCQVQTIFINNYTLMTNGGFQGRMLELYIEAPGETPMDVQFTGFVGLAGLGNMGYADDVYLWSGNSLVLSSYKYNTDTYIEKGDVNATQYSFTSNVASNFDFSCPGGKKIKGGQYTFRATVNPGAANPDIHEADFSFDQSCN